MIPKEKAKELINKHYSVITGMELNYVSKLIQLPKGDSNYETAKECALIAAKEIYKLDLIPGQYPDDCKNKTSYFSYWEEVMEEI